MVQYRPGAHLESVHLSTMSQGGDPGQHWRHIQVHTLTVTTKFAREFLISYSMSSMYKTHMSTRTSGTHFWWASVSSSNLCVYWKSRKTLCAVPVQFRPQRTFSAILIMSAFIWILGMVHSPITKRAILCIILMPGPGSAYYRYWCSGLKTPLTSRCL